MTVPDDRSKKRERLPYPPPFQDLRTLVLHVSLSKRTIEEMVRLGQFPQPRRKFGKRLWVWKEVEQFFAAPDDETPFANLAERVRLAAIAMRVSRARKSSDE
jgi:predicted DNA-binding transcriptional regulator AlpA